MEKKQTGTWNPNAYTPLTRAEILEAQKHTQSASGAARYLGTTLHRYRKYAEIHGIYEQHKNQRGVGIAKGFASRPSSIPLKDIFENKHPTYNLVRLKYRLIAQKLLTEECALCGCAERRITDGKTPLLLSFRNGVRDYQLSNLILLCYNCLFLTTGSPSVASRNYIKKSFTDPSYFKNEVKNLPGYAIPESEVQPAVSPDDIAAIQAEALHELNNTV